MSYSAEDTVGEIVWKSIDAAVDKNMAAFYATIMESFQLYPARRLTKGRSISSSAEAELVEAEAALTSTSSASVRAAYRKQECQKEAKPCPTTNHHRGSIDAGSCKG